MRRTPLGKEKATALKVSGILCLVPMQREANVCCPRGGLSDTPPPPPPQGLLAIIPGLVLVGAASTQLLLYFGLALYSFGQFRLLPAESTTLHHSMGSDIQVKT